MAKRRGSLTEHTKSKRSPKTKKRLAAKAAMLTAKKTSQRGKKRAKQSK